MLTEIVVDNRRCRILVQGKPEVVFLLATVEDHGQEWESLVEHLTEAEAVETEADADADVDAAMDASKDASVGYAVVAWPVRDWNGELSPWPAPAVFGKEAFAGNGAETLAWLETRLLPMVKERFGEKLRILCGYSLAGLFSLWGWTQREDYAGAVSCSGSLWYDGWQDYLRQWQESRHNGQENIEVNNSSLVYLSLGRKEERTRNPRMAKVGDATRAMAAELARDEHVAASILEWNEGGHFADSGERLARGIRWMLQQYMQQCRRKQNGGSE